MTSARRHIARLGLLSLLLGLPGERSVAQPAAPPSRDLQFDMFVGYDGVVPEAAWVPVVFEVKNDGPPFMGAVEVTPANFSQAQRRVAVVELPTGTLKRFGVPVFSSSRYPGGWNARLLDERGRVRAEQLNMPPLPRKHLSWRTPMMGALPRTAGGVPALRQILVNQPELQPTCARLQPAIFPDNPLVLEGLDAIYLNSERALELRETQARALLAWLHAGGHLIVGVEQIGDVNASPWLRSVFPCDLTDMRTAASHRELQAWLRSPPSNLKDEPGPVGVPGGNAPGRSGTRTPGSVTNLFAGLSEDAAFEAAGMTVVAGKLRDGRVVAGSAETPLIVTADRGRGRVTALLFSPEREPVRSWKNLTWFWTRLAEAPLRPYVFSEFRNYSEPSSDGIFGAMVDSRQVRKMPVGWLLLLLAVYQTVIGPLDRWWLKKINRPMLTWITFPAYVVLFSLLIYFIGYRLRAGESEWNELHVVDVLPAGERAELRGRTYASVYSPVNQRYRIASQQRFAAFRGESLGSYATQEKGEGRVQQQGDAFSAEVFVPVWISQLYVSDWWEPASLPVGLSVADEGASVRVTVDNRQDRALTGARLAVAGRLLDLGDIPARQTKTLTLRRDAGVALADFVWQRGANFQHVVQQRQYAFGGETSGRIDDVTNAAIAASFLSQLGERQGNVRFVTPPGLDLTPLVERGQAVLLAWARDYSPIAPLNQFSPRRLHRDTLWRIACPIEK